MGKEPLAIVWYQNHITVKGFGDREGEGDGDDGRALGYCDGDSGGIWGCGDVMVGGP